MQILGQFWNLQGFTLDQVLAASTEYVDKENYTYPRAE